MKKYFRQIAYLTLCLFLLNSGFSVAASYNIASQSDNGDGLILICTSLGLKWVSIDDLTDIEASQSHIKKSLHDCPLCYSGNSIIDSPLVDAALFLAFDPTLQLRLRGLITVFSPPSFYYYRQAHPRAPPLI